MILIPTNCSSVINKVKIRLNIIVTCLRALNCGFYYTRAALPFMKKGNACIHKYYTLRFYFPYLSLLAQSVNTLVYTYYTLCFYFPYLSLLAQPVNITLYGPGLDCLVFDSVPERYLHYYFR